MWVAVYCRQYGLYTMGLRLMWGAVACSHYDSCGGQWHAACMTHVHVGGGSGMQPV